MLKYVILVFIMVFIMGCTTIQVKTGNDIVRISNKKTISTEEYNELLRVLRDKNQDIEMRSSSFDVLYHRKYYNLQKEIEKLLPFEEDLKKKFIDYSLKRKDFNYSEQDKILIYNTFIKQDKYLEFITLYSYEFIEIEEKILINIYNEIDSENLSLLKLLNLININKNKTLFEIVTKRHLDKSVEYFIEKKPIWIQDFFINYQSLFEKFTSKMNKDYYVTLKPVFYKFLENSEENVSIVMAEKIINFEGKVEEKITSDNYYIQIEAIKKYGLSQSRNFLSKKLEEGDNSYEVLRGLSYLRIDNIFEVLKENYVIDNKAEILELFFLVGDEESLDFFGKQIIFRDKKTLLDIFINVKKYNTNKSIDLAQKLLENEESTEIRKATIEFLSLTNIELFIKIANTIFDSEKYTLDEKNLVLKRLSVVLGEDSKEQVLRSFERKVYQIKLEEEKFIFSFSDKIKLWEKYLENLPESYYKTEIVMKIEGYNQNVLRIKNEIFEEVDKKTIQLENKIKEYENYIKKEKNVEKVRALEEKINKLKQEINNVKGLSKVSLREKIMEMQQQFFSYRDELNSISQQKYFLQNSKMRREKEIERLSKTIRIIDSKRAVLIEKIRIYYGFYIDEKTETEDKFILHDDLLRYIGN